jgi:hypothetical protein
VPSSLNDNVLSALYAIPIPKNYLLLYWEYFTEIEYKQETQEIDKNAITCYIAERILKIINPLSANGENQSH